MAGETRALLTAVSKLERRRFLGAGVLFPELAQGVLELASALDVAVGAGEADPAQISRVAARFVSVARVEAHNHVGERAAALRLVLATSAEEFGLDGRAQQGR